MDKAAKKFPPTHEKTFHVIRLWAKAHENHRELALPGNRCWLD